MSLTREQKRDLNQLSEYLKKIEKLSVENSIDLDVFVTDYNRDGFSIYTTEKISLNSDAQKRKNIFEKDANEKLKSRTATH